MGPIVRSVYTPTVDSERLAYVAEHPTRLDASAVDALADLLAAQRHLDDVLESRMLLPSVDLQWRELSRLARTARGPHASALHHVVAEWSQFVGWIDAEARYDGEAVRALTEAADQADSLEDGVLAAQVENFRGYLERQRRNPRGIVRHFISAYHTPGASRLQRIGDAVQAAHGFALLDDRQQAERLLGEASDLAEAADDDEPPTIAYWLTPSFSRMGIGLAHLALGDRNRAADNLRSGLDSLPTEHAASEWAGDYRVALAEAVA